MTLGKKIALVCVAVFAVLAGVGGFVFGRYWIDNRNRTLLRNMFCMCIRKQLSDRWSTLCVRVLK